MRLPGYLLRALEIETAKAGRAVLVRAAQELTRHYKAADFSAPAVNTATQRSAYLAVRLPATYAACANVFAEVHRLAPQESITSFLDLGAGPGTALLAAAEIFPALERATLVEADRQWIGAGKRIAAQSPRPAVCQAEWLCSDLRSGIAADPCDLVVLSYALGELPAAAAEGVLRQAWRAATKILVIVEPGTMRGFGVVNTARSLLISAGAMVVAPCPHQDACPMALAGDWCHFSQRVERTHEHRLIKGGALGFEDEKFSYLAFSRLAIPAVRSRIVRHPGKHSGHVQLELCTPEGLQARTVTRSNKTAYQKARKAQWGEEWAE